MYKQISLFLFIIVNCQLSIIYCHAQNPFHFVKKYGYPSANDVGYNILQNTNSSYLISADNCHICTDQSDLIKRLYKIDEFGNVLFFNNYPDTIRNMYNYDFKKNISGNRLIVAGCSIKNIIGFGTKNVGEIMVYDTLGNKLYETMIGDTVPTTSVLNILPIAENEILFCGAAILDTIISPSVCKAVIGKIDTLGNTIWLNYYPSPIFAVNPFNSIMQDIDGNYIAAGINVDDDYLTFSKAWFHKFDANGIDMWDTKPVNNAGVKNIIKGNDGNPVFCGIKALDVPAGQGVLGKAPWVGKINHNGQILWQYNFTWGNNVPWTYGNESIKIVSAHGNGYVLFANVYPVPFGVAYNKAVPLIVKLSENGQELWRKTYRVPDDSIYIDSLGIWSVFLAPGVIYDGIATNDGGYGATGRVHSITSGADIYMLKVNCNGDTASPKAAMNVIVDAATPNLMQVYNLSQYYDTCTFIFSDNSPNINLTMYDTVQTFAHAFAPSTTVTCIAKACNQEWDTVVTEQIITNNYNLKTNQGYLQNPIPNPTNGNATISYYLPPNTKQASITITNLFGQLVNTYPLKINEGFGSLSLGDCWGEASGIYMINLVTENGMIGNRKLVVQN